MMSQIPPLAFYAVAAVLAGLYGGCLAATQGCLHVGRAISTTGSKTGFQSSITPPIIAQMMWLFSALLLAVVGFAFWTYGVNTGGLALGAAVLAMVIGMKIAPNPTSPSWVRMIYGSMVRRAADYAKQNDKMRAEATLHLVKMIENKFGRELAG
jgi:hypothetical protein